jgi:hypothetical protein
MRFPVNAPYRITQGFSAGHPGVDIAPQTPGQTGIPIYASESGVIVVSGYKASPEGHYIILHGNSGHFYYYGHLARRDVVTNARVNQGNRIGIMGRTGLASNIHLHYEVRRTRTGGQLNPLTYHNQTQGSTFMWQTSAPVFNARYYLDNNADVRRFRNTLAYARQHWLQHGMREGRPSAPNFHAREYRANYADVRRVFGSDYTRIIKHYFEHGINEQRDGRTKKPAPVRVVERVVDTSTEVKNKIINYIKNI